jgi:hypothetical protein
MKVVQALYSQCRGLILILTLAFNADDNCAYQVTFILASENEARSSDEQTGR